MDGDSGGPSLEGPRRSAHQRPRCLSGVAPTTGPAVRKNECAPSKQEVGPPGSRAHEAIGPRAAVWTAA